MLPLYHQLAFYLHVSIGSLALFVFWLPLFAKKGSKYHIKFGQYFVYGMYAVAISGFIMSLLVIFDPIGIRYPGQSFDTIKAAKIAYNQRVFSGFLFMLSILVFCSVRHSIHVLKVKQDRDRLKTVTYLSPILFLGIMGAIMGWVGFVEELLLFKIFAGLSVAVSIGMIRYIFKAKIKQREWIIEHLGSILGAGIGTYTAFFAFGGSRLFSELLIGNLQVLPWVLPSIIGITASIYLSKKYRLQFHVK